VFIYFFTPYLLPFQLFGASLPCFQWMGAVDYTYDVLCPDDTAEEEARGDGTAPEA